jgi:hypothetical protein
MSASDLNQQQAGQARNSAVSLTQRGQGVAPGVHELRPLVRVLGYLQRPCAGADRGAGLGTLNARPLER